jgi:hypothetical protein
MSRRKPCARNIEELLRRYMANARQEAAVQMTSIRGSQPLRAVLALKVMKMENRLRAVLSVA